MGRTTYKDSYLNYNVLYTDYCEYAVIYSCDEWMGGLYHTINTQILSRKPYLTPTLYNEALSKLKMAVPKEYDLENDLIWSGKGCGWNLCSKDTLTNHEELPGEPGYIEDKTIEKITYQVNSEPPKPIILDDYLKTSQCIATYSAWNIYEDAEL